MLQLILQWLSAPLARLREEQTGAVGWLIVGIIVGAIGIIVLIVKLLIPGD